MTVKKLGLVFFILILVFGCLKSDYRLEVPETRSWPESGIADIFASSFNGAISVSASTDSMITVIITRICYGKDEADAKKHIDNIIATDSIHGDRLYLETDMPTKDNYTCEFDISCPESKSILLRTTNGPISTTDMGEGCDLSSENGAVTLSNSKGDVVCSTENGAVDCDMALLAASDTVDILTTNGAVLLALPSDVSASFDAKTTNGAISVLGFTNVTFTINEYGHKVGMIGTGDATISIETTNGSITIQAR
jgi:hypothetical protein